MLDDIEKEIQRMRLISGYNRKDTLTENENYINHSFINVEKNIKNYILERGGAGEVRTASTAMKDLSKVLKAAEDSKAGMKDLGAVSKELKAVESEIFSNVRKMGGEIKTMTGEQLKSVDDVVNAVKSKNISPAELGRFNWGYLKSNVKADSEAAKLISKDIATNPSTIKRYANHDYNTIVADLVKVKNIPTEKAEVIAREIELIKKEAAMTDDIIKKSEDAIKKSEDAIKKSEDAIGATEQEIKAIEQEIESTKGQIKKTEELTKKLEELNLTKKEQAMLEDEAAALRRNLKKNPRGILARLRQNKIIRGFGKIITNKYVIALALIGGGGYLLWKNFFQDNGVTVEDDGSKLPGTGGDDSSGSDGGNGGTNVSPEEKRKQDEWKNNPNAGDGEPGDPLAGKYVKCSDKYKLLCMTTPAYPLIQLLQRFVGVKPTGKWGTKTDEAVRNKFGKSELTDAEIRDTLMLEPTGSLPALT
jgi:hypothetical protein